ncbi:MAG: hypothetical protein CVV27_03025 [Candidatus Melainabacteria bacterium HGW-Melainabacteria-1]|nr:MAG: hypothetical protein CVV27_03025 [Candidatus Melainabacteria bacterium HGW-Melainabacteria-1]
MDTSELQAFDPDFGHLLLLVGTNPLPPFVVASYFLETRERFSQLKQIWLLYSEAGPQQTSTHRPAQLLQTALMQRFGIEVSLHPIREIGSAPAIQQDVGDLTQALQGQQVHFNYSGGTKAMALHTYRVLEQDPEIACSFSYLDGRRFRIICDNRGTAIHPGELRSLVRISLPELILLHDFSLYAPITNQIPTDFEAPLASLGQLLAADRIEEFWGLAPDTMGWSQLRDPLMKATAGIHDIDKPKYLKLFGKQLRKTQEAYHACLETFQPSEAFTQVLAAFEPAFPRLGEPLGEIWEDPWSLSRCYRMLRFLDGIWLEMHSFSALLDVLSELKLNADACMGLELRQTHWKTYFEVDIAVLIGYQLLGISCTTLANKRDCKHKGFEIIHRVRQIGGDEVREVLKMMLVTYVSEQDRERLQQELAVATGTGKANILVCGREDLERERLKQRIRDFLTY